MNITDEQIDAIFGDSPFIARRTLDKTRYEVVQKTNADWRETIGTDDDFKHLGYYQTQDEATTAQRRLHVRWVLVTPALPAMIDSDG